MSNSQVSIRQRDIWSCSSWPSNPALVKGGGGSRFGGQEGFCTALLHTNAQRWCSISDEQQLVTRPSSPSSWRRDHLLPRTTVGDPIISVCASGNWRQRLRPPCTRPLACYPSTLLCWNCLEV
ncbi:unnamed protein product [Linum trigynum]|uniref:Uncharacterized protein n=1 Tax=Linum trigynum TaxID=586398 RepID=A0AAV2CWD7_9ROSI